MNTSAERISTPKSLMIDQKLRPVVGRCAIPVTKILARLGVTPNFLTVLAFFVSSSAGVAVIMGHPFFALILWWLGRLMDSLDGELARYLGKTSVFGAFLDITLDMLAYSFLIVCFDRGHPAFHTSWILILFLYIGCITSALSLGVLQDSQKKERSDNRGLRLASGLAEGGETGIAYSLFFIFPEHLSILVPIWIGILALTVIARIFYAFFITRV